MKTTLVSIAFVLVVMFSSCAGDKKDDVVTIKTQYGDMVIVLFDETPKHKENFLKLAREKFYDGTLFHRVIAGFMIQGGDPDSKNAAPDVNLGTGGPGYTVPAEFNSKFFHEKGALAAARLGDQMNPKKESSGSQFYIVQGQVIPELQLRLDQNKMLQALRGVQSTGKYKGMLDTLQMVYETGDMNAYADAMLKCVPRVERITGMSVTVDVSPEKLKAYTTQGGVPFLDDQYTVFGKVIKGLEVIDKIAAVQTGPGDRPVENVAMTVTVEKMSRKKIEKEYGYKYPEVAK